MIFRFQTHLRMSVHSARDERAIPDSTPAKLAMECVHRMDSLNGPCTKNLPSGLHIISELSKIARPEMVQDMVWRCILVVQVQQQEVLAQLEKDVGFVRFGGDVKNNDCRNWCTMQNQEGVDMAPGVFVVGPVPWERVRL